MTRVPATSPVPAAILQTARLKLRPPTVADAPAIFGAYAQDPQVTRFVPWRPHRDVAETVAFLQGCEAAWREGGRFPWVIELAASGELLGMIELRLPPDPAGGADLGYVLARPHWGRGYATEALAAVVQAALALPAVRRVWAVVDVENVASQRVLEKAGLRREALLPRHLAHPNAGAEPRDVYRHAIER